MESSYDKEDKAAFPCRDIILDSIADGVFTIDLDWRITSFNRASEEITGVPRDEAIGRPCCEVFRTDICETNCVLRLTMETGRPIINKPISIIRADGEQIPISVSTAILKDAKGNIIGGVETFRDLSQVVELRKELLHQYTVADIISRSHNMQKLFLLLPKVAKSESTVLIEGASGTGKELFAQAIHNLSTRAKKPFITVNCAALPDTLLESELFGYKAGAFTDAKKDRPGRFALAEGGTIFLDEIGDISPALQVRLLRVLQNGSYEALVSSIHSLLDMSLESVVRGHGEVILRGEVHELFNNDLAYLDTIRSAVKGVLARGEPMASLENITIESCGKSRIPLNGFVTDLHQANLRKLYLDMKNGN